MKGSDNPYPSVLVVEGTTPANPASGDQRLFIDSADHKLKRVNSSGTVTTVEGGGTGNVAADTIWDAAGDLAVGTGADTAAKLSLGATGKVPQSNGSTLAYVYPPGYEFDRATKTTGTSVTATAWGSATTVITGNAVTYDGSTEVIIEFFSPALVSPASNNLISISFFDGATQLGVVAAAVATSGGVVDIPVFARRFWTPSAAAHTITVKSIIGSTGTGTVAAGDGSDSNTAPAFLRITKA